MKRADIEALQLERLKWTVDYCINNVKFYHDRLTPLGITGDKIKCLKDIQYIPYTTETGWTDPLCMGRRPQYFGCHQKRRKFQMEKVV